MRYLPLSFLILSFSLHAETPSDQCDVKDAETKAFTELAKHVGEIDKKIVGKKTKKKKLDQFECKGIVDLTYPRYVELLDMTYKNYRQYLNQSLLEATKDDKEVQNFKKFAEFLRKGDSLTLMQNNAKAFELEQNALKNDDDKYSGLHEKAQRAEEELQKSLIGRYKIMRRNLKQKDILPMTEHNCEYYNKEHPEKVLDRLILKDPALSVYHNVCTETPYDRYPHPKEQKVISFQFGGGRAMVWYCQQNFNSRQTALKERGNYGPGRDTMVTSTANCLSYDLLNDHFMLGDQKQKHISYEVERDITVGDSRVKLAEKKGILPLSYAEYIKSNLSLIPEVPQTFFQKIIPEECRSLSIFKESIEKAKQYISEQEKPDYRKNLEY